jgi:4-aminobutyrate aminotransferase-like enzyme
MNADGRKSATHIPGPRSRELLQALRHRESRNVTAVSEDFPVVWERGEGAFVTDSDGNRYVDLTAAFGVANVGHANPRVARAIADQAAALPHAMGDVHPSSTRIAFLERLATIVPEALQRTFLASTGSEAIEAAMKTAVMATGRSTFAAFRGAYHGLSVGALALCGIEKFRAPFAGTIASGTVWLDYPHAGTDVRDAIATTAAQLRGREDVAAVFVEPIQGRGGCIVPPDGYLAGLRGLCDELGILLVVDEIYTGFARTGTWFAIQRENVVPDVLCVGKAMGGGFPISAAIATRPVMDAWPASQGEALHTSTYLGNPMGCAAALAVIEECARLDLPARSRQLGEIVHDRCARWHGRYGITEVRGRGGFWGIAFEDAGRAERLVKRALQSGIILLQSGAGGSVVTIGPPLIIEFDDLKGALDEIEICLKEQ